MGVLFSLDFWCLICVDYLKEQTQAGISGLLITPLYDVPSLFPLVHLSV